MTDVADWKEVGALIDEITEIANISSVDLVDRITLIDLITKISTITTVSTITAITNIVNLESLDLIDRITLIDTISAITNISSLDLIDRITLIDEITKIGVAYVSDYVDPDLVFLDTFEDTPISWVASSGATVARDTTYVYRGAGSLKLTTGAVASQLYYAARTLGKPTDGTYKNALRFTIPSSGLEYAELVILWYDGAKTKDVRVRYDRANNKWQYTNSSGAFVDITGGSQNLKGGDTVWHYLELEIDFVNDEYEAFKCDGLSVDMSGIAIQAPAGVTAQELTVRLYGSPSAAAAVDLYFDDVGSRKV